MKKLFILIVLCLSSYSSFAQIIALRKGSENSDDAWYKEQIADKVNYYENGMTFSASYAMGFSPEEGDLDVTGRYGLRLEGGYLTSGQLSVYAGLAYQFIGNSYKIEDIKCGTAYHSFEIPVQACCRFGGNVPVQLKAGPSLGILLAQNYTIDGDKTKLKVTDRFYYATQFNCSISYVTVGFTIQHIGGSGEEPYKVLTLGVAF